MKFHSTLEEMLEVCHEIGENFQHFEAITVLSRDLAILNVIIGFIEIKVQYYLKKILVDKSL